MAEGDWELIWVWVGGGDVMVFVDNPLANIGLKEGPLSKVHAVHSEHRVFSRRIDAWGTMYAVPLFDTYLPLHGLG